MNYPRTILMLSDIGAVEVNPGGTQGGDQASRIPPGRRLATGNEDAMVEGANGLSLTASVNKVNSTELLVNTIKIRT